ncbi:MAG: hypothetical protein NMNS01_24990 [Nitrosomonas sp.]|nr:MAG: hypothetical protein NMNS01_24990 [Nitrosomonas sp.]
MLLLLAPVVISYTLFFSDYRPESSNYGELLNVQKLSGSGVDQSDNTILRMKDLRGKWVMLMVNSGHCDEACQLKLYYMRQVRLVQNTEKHRVERLWLIDDNVPVDADLVEKYEGTRFVNARDSELLELIATRETQQNHIFLVDPMGNLMMRFPEDLDPSLMAKDIKHLLHVSQIEH